MRMNEGRIGVTGAAALTSAAMITNGLFALDPELAYSSGNSAYLALPLSALLSLVVSLCLIGSMKRSGSRDLAEHLQRGFGRVGAALAAIPFIAALLFCALEPTVAFLRVLHRLVYDGVSYTAILFFVFPITVFAAWRGIETLSRTAIVLVTLMLVSFAAASLAAIPDFETYRLYPIMGDGVKHFAYLTLTQTLAFLPPLSAAAIHMSGMNGARSAQRTVLFAALASALIMGLAELSVSMIYPYRVLAGLLTPLYRINFLSLSQSYLIRLDKLYITVWLGVSILSSAYMINSAARLFARCFGQKDVTPAAASLSLMLLAFELISVTGEYGFLSRTHRALVRFGWLGILTPVLAAALIRAGRSRRKV